MIGIEVKSGATRYHSGMASFKGKYHPHKVFLVGSDGMPWQEFLLTEPNELFA